MFLSIVIPIWNDEKYLEQCLDSCLDQEISSEEYEIICVDDGSTDRTPIILQTYASRFSNIRVITKKHGIAFGYGRDIGFEAAQGEYVWFVDHDDLVAPNAIDQLFEIAEHNREYDRIAFPCYEFYEELSEAETAAFHNHTLMANDQGRFWYGTLWSSIIKMQFFLDNDIRPHSKRITEAENCWDIHPFVIYGGDSACIQECLDHNIRSITTDGRPLYHYRRIKNSESMQQTPEAVQRRITYYFNTAMYQAYLCLLAKKEYQNERKLLGCASPETTAKLIVKLRGCAMKLSTLPREYWKQGIHRVRQEGLFFTRKPEEYRYGLFPYLRKIPKIKRFFLSSIVGYYTYSVWGTYCYRLLMIPRMIAAKSGRLAKWYHEKKAERLRDYGIDMTK